MSLINNLKLWQLTLLIALLPLARFGIVFSGTGLTGTVIIVNDNGVPLEGAILQITALEVAGTTFGWPAMDYPADASGTVDLGMTTFGVYYFTVTAPGYNPIADSLTVDGVENVKTVQMQSTYTPNPPDPPDPPVDKFTLSWLDGVTAVFGLSSIGIFLKKPEMTLGALLPRV